MFHISKKNWASGGCRGGFYFSVLFLSKHTGAVLTNTHQCVNIVQMHWCVNIIQMHQCVNIIQMHQCINIIQTPQHDNIIKKHPDVFITIVHQFCIFHRMHSINALIISRHQFCFVFI
jgi:hypothetical protein